MTLTLPRLLRGPSLRALVLLLVLSGAVYAAVVALYLTANIRTAASTLGEATVALVSLQDDLGKRREALSRAVHLSHDLIANARPRTRAELNGIRQLASVGSVRERAEPYASVPSDLRLALARVDEQMSGLGGALGDVVALIEVERLAEARRALAGVDALLEQVNGTLATATQLARADLVSRQAVLRQSTGRAFREGLLLLAAGMLFVPLAILVVRRRIWTPLERLEKGLQRVSDGDLTAQVVVARSDELGRLGTHFNQMTRILRDRAEEQGRFAAAGELLAGVAHEVNNPLMAIASHAELRLVDAELPAEQRTEMQSILRQAQRAAKLLRGLLRFVRAGEKRAASVNLNEVVRSAIDLVSYRFSVDEISIEGQLDPALPPAVCDANRMEQVLVNLLSNALDALRSVKPPRRLIVDSYVENKRVCVTVTDNGPGVAPEIVERLFLPFATTKGRRGTGLGLYISRQLVREAEGDLDLVPHADRGARFLVWLPAAPVAVLVHGAPAVPAAVSAVPPQSPRPASLAGIRVLLVDDEELIRRPMSRFLTKRGAEVTEAGDGEAALELLRAGGDPQVILADLRMPRMDGAEFYAQLQIERPALADRVLFLSGDITQLAGRGLAQVPRDRVLVKPLELAELEQRIREFVQETAV